MVCFNWLRLLALTTMVSSLYLVLVIFSDTYFIVVTTEDFEAGFVAGVKRDHEMLKALKAEWGKVTIDPKIDIINHL
jgi:hypothetical protein